MNDTSSNLVDYSLYLGEMALAGRSQKERKRNGQFLTPTKVARFMTRQLGPIQNGDRIMDPAIGSGTLLCAVIERVISQKEPIEFWVEGYETDRELCQTARQVLKRATALAAPLGITIHAQVHECDFVLDSNSLLQSQLPLLSDSNISEVDTPFTHIIANPPYFKLNKSDPRVRAIAGKVKGHTNIYTLFIALSTKRLSSNGRACFIVPRSFCSGTYFSAFRRELVSQTVPLHIHLFESREQIFRKSAVLQENVIFTFRRRQPDEEINQHTYLTISTSQDTIGLDKPISRRISTRRFLGERLGELFFRLPTSELDEQVLDTIDGWPGSVAEYGMRISTGPIVPFRTKEQLANIKSVKHGKAVPLLWMHNITPYQVTWPADNGNKPQGILLTAQKNGLLLPKANYILLRRFSAKEEPRRLITAPLLSEQYHHRWVGLENHLNYISRKGSSLKPEEALGLTALLNSALVDRYFRIVNGNTQVNATELRALPLPPLNVIEQIGKNIKEGDSKPPEAINTAVFSILHQHGYLDENFPIIQETRITMGKIQQAREVLQSLGMPQAQQNEISALTLLVLAGLSETTPWSEAQTRCLRIHDMMREIKALYDREYAENTRETIRRQVLDQFVQAGIAVPNPDEPERPTNSPHFCYALTDLTLKTKLIHLNDGVMPSNLFKRVKTPSSKYTEKDESSSR